VNVILSGDSIGKAFRRRHVLTAASVRVRPGIFTALLGRNGCGKSTLLRILVGEIRADHGTIAVDGVPTPRPRLHDLAGRGIMHMPERGLLTPRMSVGEHIAWIGRRFGHADHDRIIELLRIDAFLDATPRTLSTGERRRCEVALALMRAPRCLIADEPLQGIEPLDVQRIADGFRELRARGCALLVTGHEVPDVLALADEVVWMTAGTTHHLGAPERALRHHGFRKDYLGADTAMSNTPVRTTP
jgi:ABC-type multidrug transport system ATPase subunit